MNKFTYRKLEWDTKYFGCDSSRIDIHQELEEDDIELIKECIKLDKFVTITNPKGFVTNNKKITHRLGAYLVDLNVHLVNDQVSMYITESTKNMTIENNLDYCEDVLDLVKGTFNNSRFSNDDLISSKQSDGIYTQWVKNSFSKNNKYFCLYRNGNSVEGFILFSIDKINRITIELVSVNNKCRSMGIGTALFNELHRFARDNGIRIATVGTQLENISAINFYNKNNYRIRDICYTYHLWQNGIDREDENL